MLKPKIGTCACKVLLRRSGIVSRQKSTSLLDSTIKKHAVNPPTPQQLQLIFLNTAIPMVGFGFMDQTIMLQAGNAIDCTLGVMFGLSTLTAAAFGQVCSDGAGVLFGRSLEQLFSSIGVPKSGVTNAQRALPIVTRTKVAGNFLGVVLGCTLGLVNLLFIDTTRSSSLKLEGVVSILDSQFSVEISNEERNDVTTLRVYGPDVDGLLASMTAVLSNQDCSIVELHARRKDDSEHHRSVDDVIHVVKRSTGEPFSDDEIEDLANNILDTVRTVVETSSDS